MSNYFAATLCTSRQVPVRARWRPFYMCSRRLSTTSNPALFRLLEDGTEQPITEDDLFRYQRHRWLRNDAKEQDVRYRPFNLAALIERALKAKRGRIDGQKCIKILKLVEGDHNKVFLLTMSDGDELIARLPNPNAGSNYFTVASEVATRRFIKSTCNVPMPTVWDWDFRGRNTVGADWIIEAKAAGEPLRNHWFNMSRRAQLKIVEQVVHLESELTRLKFSSHGSLYMERWLSTKRLFCTKLSSPNAILNRDDALKLRSKQFYGQYAIGSSTDRKLYRGPGDLSKQFRGPFTDLLHYAKALSRNERRYMLNSPWAKENYITSMKIQQDPSEYVKLILKYAALQEQLIQPEFENDPCTISHPNLSLDNIFIDPKTEKIASLTGWQSTVVSPPLLKRPYPPFLDSEFQTISDDRMQPLPKERYRELVKESDPLRYERIFSDPQEYELLIGPISNIFGAWNRRGLFDLRESLIATRKSKKVSTESIPKLGQFSPQELQNHAKEKYARQELDLLFNMIQSVQENVQIPRDGRVRSEEFERAQELSEEYRQQYLSLAEGDENRKALHEKTWPFDSPSEGDVETDPSDTFQLRKHLREPRLIRRIFVN
ncbi:mitochondria protein Fmp29, putative [Talaromyces stipitatus ATCC 10500]|uniref:Altered inheritance of mitochondria protein 9, mitochondrial n=1 Tax=Talaromyces stipitatus (strain ATCC 10500 / CBS 375.48 / QM 6759 / NRRL 1006) TaxID=441959 RepID=B8M7N7_TALSN|nr:mitochondria protein Fmp29, putative [Talaromyces stipitatus ATCC 10500]EED19590.1 mitochondria protein Fmp29, putative [Talaromyces stipitatus ATCC 10500]